MSDGIAVVGIGSVTVTMPKEVSAVLGTLLNVAGIRLVVVLITLVMVAAIPDVVIMEVVEPMTIPLRKVKMVPFAAVSRLVPCPKLADTIVDVAIGVEIEARVAVGIMDPMMTLFEIVKTVPSVAVTRLNPCPTPADADIDTEMGIEVGIVDPMTVPPKRVSMVPSTAVSRLVSAPSIDGVVAKPVVVAGIVVVAAPMITPLTKVSTTPSVPTDTLGVALTTLVVDCVERTSEIRGVGLEFAAEIGIKEAGTELRLESSEVDPMMFPFETVSVIPFEFTDKLTPAGSWLDILIDALMPTTEVLEGVLILVTEVEVKPVTSLCNSVVVTCVTALAVPINVEVDEVVARDVEVFGLVDMTLRAARNPARAMYRKLSPLYNVQVAGESVKEIPLQKAFPVQRLIQDRNSVLNCVITTELVGSIV